MKVLWLDINSSYSHSSLAIPAMDAQLSASVKEMHSWEILSGSLKMGISWFTQRAVEYSPDIILSTLWLFNHSFAMEVLSRVHSLIPGVRIVLGGPEFLGENEGFLNKNRFVEAVFRGEGEEVFPEFVKRMGETTDCYEMDGFCYLDKNGNYRDNGTAQVKSFHKLLPPEQSIYFPWDKPFVQLETSRGCFNRCAFCISGNQSIIDEVPLAEMEIRIEKIHKRGIKEIRILDRTFNANTIRASKMVRLFSKYNGEIEFHTEIHPSFMESEFRDSIEKAPAGTLHFEAGIQSFQEKTLASCNRYDKKEKTINGIKYLSSLEKHQVHTDLIAGLPFYTYQQLIDDLHILIEINPAEIQLESLKLLPGTELRKKAGEYGIKFSQLPPYEVLETPDISHTGLIKAHFLSVIIDLYYNNPEWRGLLTGLVTRNNSFLEKFTDHFFYAAYGKSLNNENKGLIIWNFCNSYFPAETEAVSIKWMEIGLSFTKGPGAESIPWKYSDMLHNPLFDKGSREHTYRYLEYPGRRHWFSYNRKTNSSKSLAKFSELF